MSLLRRIISTWHSGSPKRVLYSISCGPVAVSISPAKSTPLNARPSAAIAATVGSMIRAMISASSVGVRQGAGE
jgi:hypothetical protein